MPKSKKVTQPQREKWFSVAIRFAWFVTQPQSTILELKVRADQKSEAIDRARLLFHVLHYDEATTHYIFEGIRVYPWNICAIAFPLPIARAFDAQPLAEKKMERGEGLLKT